MSRVSIVLLAIFIVLSCSSRNNSEAVDEAGNGYGPVGSVFAQEADKAPSGPPVLAGCAVFPADNIWNTPIDASPVHARSKAFIESIGPDRTLHPDFGSGTWRGGPIGIPFVTVPGDHRKVPVTFGYADESDLGPYPIPPDAPIEGGSGSDGDRHILVVDRDNCVLYEVYRAFPGRKGAWRAGSGAVFDLKSHALRPSGWTSADAAGLPILPGLVRYDEVASGEIRHAIRFTTRRTQRRFIWPARHFASSDENPNRPPLGLRVRLKANFDTSGFSPQVRVILRAMKKYGLILADNGSDWYISGAPDERWDNTLLRELKQVEGANFEAVDVSSLMIDADSGQVRSATSSQSPRPPRASEGILVTFSSDPAAAEIEIDGEYAGSTPSTVSLPVGSHSIVMTKRGFMRWERSLELRPGEQRTVHGELEQER